MNPHELSNTPCLGKEWCSYCARELNLDRYVIGNYCNRGNFWADLHMRTFFIPAHFYILRNKYLGDITICTWCDVHHTIEEAEELNKKERETAEHCYCPNCVK